MTERADLERVLRDLANAPSAGERFRDGVECPSEHALAAFAEARLAEAEERAVRAHLERCGACVADARAALEELAAIAAERRAEGRGGERAGARKGERRHPLRWVGPRTAWIGIAAAALVLALFWPLGGRAQREKAIALARVEAIAARVPRGEADEAELAFREGLALYVEGRWAEAEAELLRAEELAPERLEVALYRGSALLLVGRAQEAEGELRRASAEDGAAGEEARWQLAQALLGLGRVEEAVVVLEEVARGGARAKQAEEMRGELAEVGF